MRWGRCGATEALPTGGSNAQHPPATVTSRRRCSQSSHGCRTANPTNDPCNFPWLPRFPRQQAGSCTAFLLGSVLILPHSFELCISCQPC